MNVKAVAVTLLSGVLLTLCTHPCSINYISFFKPGPLQRNVSCPRHSGSCGRPYYCSCNL